MTRPDDPRLLADIQRDIVALDFSPYDSIESAPRELSDRLVDLTDELIFVLNAQGADDEPETTASRGAA